MKNLKKSLLLLTLLVGTLVCINFLNIPQIFAQETQGSEINLTVSPPVSYLHVAPGTAVNHTIILENNGNTSVTVLPTIVDFTTDGKTGRAIVTNQLTFPYISMGIDNSVTEVTIPPQKKAQLTLYINVPKDSEEKEYPLTVLFFSKNELEKTKNNISLQNSDTTDSQISAAIGSNLIVLVAKQNVFTKTLELFDFNAPKVIDSFGKVEFAPIVKNNSFGGVAASGSAKIVNWRKQTIAEFEIYPDIILGHNSRELRALLSNSDPKEPEVGSFSYKPKLLIGPYQIVVTLKNEQNAVITHAVHVFYAFPIVLLIAIGIGIAISLFFSRTKPKTNNL